MFRGMHRHAIGPMMDPRSRLFLALANDQRLKLLDLIEDGEKSSAELTRAIGLDASVVSRHLMMLRQVGLVQARKQGVSLFFAIADRRLFQIVSLASAIIKDWLERNQQFFQI